ncbi:unnamed protein product [Rotaria sp. Silwood2]|nr:unnamed protein product [Rotaria sp. Silwood2]CAF4505926.1 unnamed protein product [Rotaria sp. Silwood2]CAF4556060.1 unnamed protein product [Rotaria sp. Silwood2]
MKILSDNLSQQGYSGCHALLDERNVCLHKFYLYLGFTDIANIDQNDHMILLAENFKIINYFFIFFLFEKKIFN